MLGIRKLTIKYDSKDIDSKLDEALKAVAEKHGWGWWASGYDHIERRRDISFEK